MQTIKCCCYWGITGEPWEVRQKSSHSSRVVKYSQVCLSKKKREEDKKDGLWVTVDCIVHSGSNKNVPLIFLFVTCWKRSSHVGASTLRFYRKPFSGVAWLLNGYYLFDFFPGGRRRMGRVRGCSRSLRGFDYKPVPPEPDGHGLHGNCSLGP